MQGRELIKRSIEREKLKKYLITLNCLGNTSSFIMIDLMKQRDNTLDIRTDAAGYKDYKEIQGIIQSLISNNDNRRINKLIGIPEFKEEKKSKEIAEERQIQFITHNPAIKTEDFNSIDLENERIISNFDYTCIISALAQKAFANNVNYQGIIIDMA